MEGGSKINKDSPLKDPFQSNLDEYSTILCEMKAVLNSQPLSPLHSLLDDGLEALTPGHF